ncbi:MAG: UxaA family hydrolase [Methylocystaceae bacterium]
MNDTIKAHDLDTVVIAINDLKKDQTVVVEGQSITLQDDIPMGHKIALNDIAAGEDIIRFGNAIGHATKAISKGELVHIHNVFTNLKDVIDYTYTPQFNNLPAPEGPIPTFRGYQRKDGKTGIRNEIWVIPTSHCANGPATRIVEIAKSLYPKTDNFDGFYALTHPYGCSQISTDYEYTQKILANLVVHPNCAGVLVIENGCEKNCLPNFIPALGDYDKDRIRFVPGQEVEDEIQAGLDGIKELYDFALTKHRTELPISELVLAVNCGGSDTFSGITANALVGRITDLLTAWGATVVMTEVPEMFGAEHLLMNRAENKEVFNKIVEMINDYKNYFKRYGQEIYENPAPGNIAGGITTLEEKSLGCTQKGGQAIVNDVLKYGERLKKKGFNLISGPGNDIVGLTNQEACGSAMTIFTTGRGTPSGYVVPLMRVASNSRVAEKKKGWIDYDGGQLLAGKSFAEATEELLAMVIKVANGEYRPRAEANGYRQIGMLRDGVTL